LLQSLLIVLEQALLYFPLVLGAYISIALLKLPDLSIESSYVFGAIVASKVLILAAPLPSWVTFILVCVSSLLGGALVGGVAGCLTQYARVPYLLSSILTIGIFHGVNQYVLGTATVSMSQYTNPLIVNHFFVYHPELFVLLIVFFVLFLLSWLLLKTQLGVSFFVFGNNQLFFGNYGISKKFVCIVGLMLANSLAGLSGYFVVQSSGFVDVNAGFGIALFCVTSLILGKTAKVGKQPYSVFVPIMGVFFFCVVQQLLLKVGFNLKYFTMIQSMIVLVILIWKYRSVGYVRSVIDNLGV
jgi:putative ABC transport system permease protein